MTEILKHMTQT